MTSSCGKCGVAVNPGQPYCHSCGMPLTPEAWENAPAGFRSSPSAAIPVARHTDGGAIASMVLGIVGLVMIPVIASIIALALGYGARRRIEASRHLDGGGFATAGIVTGWIGVILPLGTLLLFLIFTSGF